MPKVDQAHLDARRQQILDAAVACFARDGFHRTTMQDIVRQSGLSAGALYTYFTSKEAMIEAIAEGRHRRERELILAAGQAAPGGAVLQRLVASFAARLLDPAEREGRRLSLQLWAEALRNPRVLRTVRGGVDVPRKMLTRIVEAAVARGDLPDDLEPEALARVLIALFQGFALQLAWEPSAAVEPCVEAVQRLFVALAASGRKGRRTQGAALPAGGV